MSVVSPAVAMITLRGPAGFGPAVEGEALVSTDAFSPRYDLDRDAGIVSRRDHAIAGSSIKGKVLVIPAAKGGVAAGWAFYDIAQRGIAPLALICRETNPVMVQGAVLAGIAIMHRLAPDPVSTIRSGDVVRVDPAAGTVTIVRRYACSGEVGTGSPTRTCDTKEKLEYVPLQDERDML
jgi:predicted aconitase with swiveling domain